MSKLAHHTADLQLKRLELSLELAESSFGATTEIATVSLKDTENDKTVPFTVSSHGWKRVPALSLRLLLDPEGNLEAPEGTSLVVRGTAYVASEEVKVALFREDEAERG